jgi:transposase InsO family protein
MFYLMPPRHISTLPDSDLTPKSDFRYTPRTDIADQAGYVRFVQPAQPVGWRTFLRNHAPDIAAMDLFVVPTIGFDLLYAFVIIRLHRRDLVWINVTTNPTAEWVARQITEAFPWDEAPHYLIRDRDRIYGSVVTRRLRAMGIRDKPTAPASPWQNAFAERLIGSIRRECVDHVIVLGEAHLRRVLKFYADYNSVRTRMRRFLARFSELV